MNALRNLLDLSERLQGDDVKHKLKVRFSDLADVLLLNTVIKKGEKLYWINDIEFYFYHKGHPDVFAYPRNCEAGRWFFHPSGVDISFESHTVIKPNAKGVMKPCLLDDSYFGGILIRGIQRVGEEKTIDGPWKVCDEIFDHFDAFDVPEDFPLLVEEKRVGGMTQEVRYHLLGSHEVEKKATIIRDNYLEVEREGEMKSWCDEFLNSEYRFKYVAR